MGICASSAASAEFNPSSTPIKQSVVNENGKPNVYLAPASPQPHSSSPSQSGSILQQYVVKVTAPTPRSESPDLPSPTQLNSPSPSPSSPDSPSPDPVSNSSSSSQEFTMDDVKSHKTRASCWTVVDGMVYDLTHYLPNHPGGDGIVVSKMAGKDGTAAFNSMHDDSETAKEELKRCLIGRLVSVKSSSTNSPSATSSSVIPVIPSKPAPTDYPYTITSIREINDAVRVFTFTPSSSHPSSMPLLPTGHHVSIRVPFDHIPVEKRTKTEDGNGKDLYRAYTPIYQGEDGSMELLIKVYPGGICTQYLWSLSVGSSIELRGPTGEFDFDPIYSSHKNSTWLMLGGGTGITPMYQVLVPLVQKMVSDDTNGRIIVVMASRNEAEVLMREQLQDFVDLYSSHVRIKYLLSQPPTIPSPDTIVGRLNMDVITSLLPEDFSSRPSIGLLCGPPGFVDAGVSALEKLQFQNGSGKNDRDIFLF